MIGLTGRMTKICIFLIIALSLIVPASADIRTISEGNMIFIGEEGLNIVAAMGGNTQVGWWASGASIPMSSPDRTVPVSDATNFFVSPSLFGSYTGAWYRLDATGKAAGLAFTVADPQLDLKAEDTTVSVDVTDKWAPRGDEVRFRIETNMAPISQRAGVTSTPITIRIRAPDGGMYTALVNSAGVSTSLENIPVTTTPFYTNSIWDTGNSLYATGTYRIWAECNVNRMNDNYGQTGKTISRQISVLNQDQNPLIGSRVPTSAPVTPTTTIFTPKVTTPISLPSTPVQTPSPASTTMTSVPQSPVETSTIPTSFPTQTTLPTQSPGFDISLMLISGIVGTALYLLKK